MGVERHWCANEETARDVHLAPAPRRGPAPMQVRPLTDEERQILEDVPDQPDFARRRAAIVLASARGELNTTIAARLGISAQTVRNAINAFNANGLAALSGERQTSSPQRDWFTTAEAADELGLSASTVRGMVFSGKLRAAVVAPRVRAIAREELDRYRREHSGHNWEARRAGIIDQENAAYYRAWRARRKAKAQAHEGVEGAAQGDIPAGRTMAEADALVGKGATGDAR